MKAPRLAAIAPFVAVAGIAMSAAAPQKPKKTITGETLLAVQSW